MIENINKNYPAEPDPARDEFIDNYDEKDLVPDEIKDSLEQKEEEKLFAGYDPELDEED